MKVTFRSAAVLSIALSSACADRVPEVTAVTRQGGAPSQDMYGGTWSAKAPMPTARFRAAGAVVKGKLYVIGGVGALGPAPISVVERYDASTNSWETRAPMPSPRAGAGAASVGDKIYVFGGVDETLAASNSVFIYDPATNSWTSGVAMTTARSGAPVCAFDGKLWVFGGREEPYSSEVADAGVYDPESNRWDPIEPLPAVTGYMRCFEVGGMFYVITYPYTFIYNPGNQSFTTGATPTMLLPEASGGVVGGLIYLFRPMQGLEPARGYTPATDEWATLTAPTAEAFTYQAASGVIAGVIYSAGGFKGVASNETWAFNPGYAGNHQPAASTNGPWRGVEGTAITFSGSGTDPDNDFLTYSWDFGDGDTDDGATVSHAYDDDGEYVVTLTVSDGEKSRVATSRAIVRNMKPSIAGISAATIDAGATYSGVGVIADVAGDEFEATVDWGEGAGDQPHPVSGSTIELNHQYTDPGQYNLVVTVSDGDGGVDKVSRWIRVKPWSAAENCDLTFKPNRFAHPRWLRSNTTITMSSSQAVIGSGAGTNDGFSARCDVGETWEVDIEAKLVSGGNNYVFPYLVVRLSNGAHIRVTSLPDGSFGWLLAACTLPAWPSGVAVPGFGPDACNTDKWNWPGPASINEGEVMTLRIAADGQALRLYAKPQGETSFVLAHQIAFSTAGLRVNRVGVEQPWDSHIQVSSLVARPK